MASKHLSYEERLKIQEGLSQNKAIFAIAKSIKRTNTAIRNEITRNRYLVTEKSFAIPLKIIDKYFFLLYNSKCC